MVSLSSQGLKKRKCLLSCAIDAFTFLFALTNRYCYKLFTKNLSRVETIEGNFTRYR